MTSCGITNATFSQNVPLYHHYCRFLPQALASSYLCSFALPLGSCHPSPTATWHPFLPLQDAKTDGYAWPCTGHDQSPEQYCCNLFPHLETSAPPTASPSREHPVFAGSQLWYLQGRYFSKSSSGDSL